MIQSAQLFGHYPFVGGDIPDSGADEHEGAVPVREAAHDARAPADLPAQPPDRAIRADASATPVPCGPAASWRARCA